MEKQETEKEVLYPVQYKFNFGLKSEEWIKENGWSASDGAILLAYNLPQPLEDALAQTKSWQLFSGCAALNSKGKPDIAPVPVEVIFEAIMFLSQKISEDDELQGYQRELAETTALFIEQSLKKILLARGAGVQAQENN